jgi:type IV pilus assembly protein PilE
MGTIMFIKRNRGFTLIEVMIVVAILSILTAIALPSYNEYIRRGHRADARAGLLQAAQYLERAATASGVYPTALPANLTWATDTTKRYTISIGNGAGGTSTTDAFTLTATRRTGAQAADKCGELTLTSTGVRGMVSATPSTLAVTECWDK